MDSVYVEPPTNRTAPYEDAVYEISEDNLQRRSDIGNETNKISNQGEGFKNVDHELEAAESEYGSKIYSNSKTISGLTPRSKVADNDKDKPLIAASISSISESKQPPSGPLGSNKDKMEKHSFGYKVTIYRSPGIKGKRALN